MLPVQSFQTITYGSSQHHDCILLSRLPGMKKLCTKNEMADRLNIQREFFPRKYDFYPLTWNIHSNMQQINRLFDGGDNSNSAYIIKTGAGAKGNGIWIVFTLKDIFRVIEYYTNDKQDMVPLILQKYCNNPLLTRDGFKFDFRVYVIIKSLDPFEFYICRDGLCRVCTVEYEQVTPSNSQCTTMHFTNYAVNKSNINHSESKSKRCKSSASSNRKRRKSYSMASKSNHDPKYKTKSSQKQEIKRSIDSMLFEVKHQYGDKFNIVEFWQNLDSIVHKTIITLALPLKWKYAEHFEANSNQCNCFHIIGFDILMDDKFKLWLIEINDSPSFCIDSQIDFDIKSSVMESTLQILGVLKHPNKNHETNHNVRDYLSQNLTNNNSINSLIDEQSDTSLDSNTNIATYIDNLYSYDEKQILRMRYKRFKLSLPPNKWYRHTDAIIHQHKKCKNDFNLFRIFEDPLISGIFNAYCTRYGYMNATKFIQFSEDFAISNFAKCPRSHLDLLYRDYQARICGSGGGEIDLEGFCHVLLMIAQRKQKKNNTKQLLVVWLELIKHLFVTQQKQTVKVIKKPKSKINYK